MSNIGRAIVKKLVVKFEGKEYCIDVTDFDFLRATETCGRQSWKRRTQ